MRMRASWVAAGLVGLAMGWSAVALTAASAARSSSGSGAAHHVARARARPGDLLLAGPVLFGHEVVWAEAGAHRLLVRTLDLTGRTHTLFSTRQTPGAPKNAQWPFDVPSLAAGGGRLVFVVRISPCTNPGPHSHCPGFTHPTFPPFDSSTVYAGRPGNIMPVESVDHRCGRPLEPWAAAVSDAGLIVDEEHDICRGRFTRGRLVLRGFDGRLVRVLAAAPADCSGCITELDAAGGWAGFVTGHHGGQLRIVRVSTGRTVFRRQRGNIMGGVALDPSGAFAALVPGPRVPCRKPGPAPRFDNVVEGWAGSSHLRRLASPADWYPDVPIAFAGPRAAFLEPTGHCRDNQRVALVAAGSHPKPVPGLAPGLLSSIAFNGRLLAISQGNLIQLTAVG
jgi:hypothetical protein